MQVGRTDAGELPEAGGRVRWPPEQTQQEQQHQAGYQGEQCAAWSHPEPRAPSQPKLLGRSAARAASTRRSGRRRCRRRHSGRCHAHPQRSKAVARARTLGDCPEPSLQQGCRALSRGSSAPPAPSLLPSQPLAAEARDPLADDDPPSSPPVLPEAIPAAAGSGRCSRCCFCLLPPPPPPPPRGVT